RVVGGVEVKERLVPDDELPGAILNEVERDAKLLTVTKRPAALAGVLGDAVDHVGAAGPLAAHALLDADAGAEIEASGDAPAKIELLEDPVLVEVPSPGDDPIVEVIRHPRVADERGPPRGPRVADRRAHEQ